MSNLSITSNLVDGNASGFNGYSIGKLVSWVVEVTNTNSFYGQTVYFNPGLFIDSALPFEFTNVLPEYGYSITLPTAPSGTLSASVLPGTNLTTQNYDCRFKLTTEFTLEITLIFLYTEDIDNFTSPENLSLIDRFQKNTVNSPNRFINDITPSVYNTERALRGHFVIGNIGTGAIVDQTHVDFLTEARWYESGVAGGAAEYTGWALSLERSGDVVTELSAFEDTDVKVLVDIGAGSIDIAFAEIVIYREDISTNLTDFIQGLDMGVHDKSTALYGKDYVTFFGGWNLVAGTQYEGSFTIDKDAIDVSGRYRIVVLVANAGNTITNSYQSVTIEAAALPVATAGTMVGEMFDYNFEFLANNCLQVAPYERIKACASVDKGSYDTELSGKGLPGDFETNFFSYEVIIYNSLDPTEIILQLNDRQEDPSLTITDTFADYTACVEFRIPMEQAGKAFAIDHIFTYRVNVPDLPYDDRVIFRQLVNARKTDEDPDTTDELLIRMDFFDGNNDPVSQICEDFVGPLRVEIEKNTTVPDYNLIAMLVKDIPGLTPGEEESYDNNILAQLFDPIILSVDTLFGVDDIANFTIDNTQLENGQKYRVIAVAKEENPSPPVACPLINVQSDATVLSAVPIGPDIVATLDVNFAITNFAPSAVTNVDITTTTDPKGKGPNQNNVFVTDTGNYNYIITWDGGFVSDPIVMVQNIEVTLANGCVYNVTLNQIILPIVGRITNVNTDVNAN